MTSSVLWLSDINQLSTLSVSIRNWLTQTYILSHALKSHCKQLRLEVFDENFRAALLDENECLANDATDLPWIRQIVLLGDEVPWTFGRVIIPAPTYAAHFAQLTALGGQLLGETLLYNNSAVTRSAFEYAFIPRHSELANEIFHALPAITRQDLWGRRSIFKIKNYPLMVNDILLPQLPRYKNTI